MPPRPSAPRGGSASRSKSAPSSRFITARQLRSNAAVTPASSSYAATSRSRSLIEVGAEQEPVARLEGRAHTSPRNRRRSSGSRLPMVEPRNAMSRVPPLGMCPRWRWKSPTTAATSMPGQRSAMARHDDHSISSLTSNGAMRRSVPASRSASIRSHVFSDVPEPSSTSVSAPVMGAMSSACSVRIGPFGPGRVVLGQPGDLVEELRSELVVEPDRWEPTAAATRGPVGSRRPGVTTSRSDRGTPRSRWSGSHASLASLTPLKAHRAEGGKKFRYVGRV